MLYELAGTFFICKENTPSSLTDGSPVKVAADAPLEVVLVKTIERLGFHFKAASGIASKQLAFPWRT